MKQPRKLERHSSLGVLSSDVIVQTWRHPQLGCRMNVLVSMSSVAVTAESYLFAAKSGSLAAL